MSAKDTIRAYYDAFNRQDMAAFLDLLTDDVAHDINQGERQTGGGADERTHEDDDPPLGQGGDVAAGFHGVLHR